MKREKDIARLGRVLRQAREREQLSIRQLIETSGVSFGSISGLENGEWQQPGVDQLRALAHALDLNTRDLYELAGYIADDELPSVSGLLHVQYRSLPDEAVAEIDHFVDYTLKKHGVRVKKPKKKAS